MQRLTYSNINIYNIARYIRLKPYFICIISKFKDYINQNKLKRIYNRYNKSDIFYLLYRISIVNKYLKLFYLVFIFKLLDKPRYNKLLHTVKFLKPYIISKLQSIKDNIEIDTRSSYGLDYINKNFVFNKRYFDIRKNKIYYKTLCILYIKIAYCTIKWYRDTIKKTYEPGGRGYFEAKERFTSNF